MYEDTVTTDLEIARYWLSQGRRVWINEEDGDSYEHTFGALPVVGVESYQTEES